VRSLLVASGAALCVLAMTACAADDGSGSGDNPATISAESSEVMVPDELSFDALHGPMTGDESTYGDDGDGGHGEKKCQVELVSCKDHRDKGKPTATFCVKDGSYCKDDETCKEAERLCKTLCKPHECKNIKVVKKCDHDGHDDYGP